MNFKPKSKSVTLAGSTVVIQEMSAGHMLEMPEDADMALVVALCMTGVTPEDVRGWPMSVVRELYDHAIEVCGLQSGND